MEWFKKLFGRKIDEKCCCNSRIVDEKCCCNSQIVDDSNAIRALNHIKNNPNSYKISCLATKNMISCTKKDCIIFLTKSVDYNLLKDEKEYCYFLEFYKGMEKLESWQITEQANIEIIVSIFNKISKENELFKTQKIETFLKELEQ